MRESSSSSLNSSVDTVRSPLLEVEVVVPSTREAATATPSIMRQLKIMINTANQVVGGMKEEC